MMFFQLYMLIVAVISVIGAIAEERKNYRYVALFVASGILYLAAWTLSKTYF